MGERYKVFWTSEAKSQTDQILKHLLNNWSEKECKDFLDLLYHFEITISLFPKSFKLSKKYKDCRLGFIHKHITAIYKISRKTITILTIIDNKSIAAK